jgi:hypothetical protein
MQHSRAAPAGVTREDVPMPRHGARSLVLWSWIVLALLAAHDVTHVVDEGIATPLGLLALIAIPQWIVLAVVMAIIVHGDRAQSRAAALVLGSGVAAGFAVVHLLPGRPTGIWGLEPSPVSWLLAWVTTAAGLLLAALARRRTVAQR